MCLSDINIKELIIVIIIIIIIYSLYYAYVLIWWDTPVDTKLYLANVKNWAHTREHKVDLL